MFAREPRCERSGRHPLRAYQADSIQGNHHHNLYLFTVQPLHKNTTFRFSIAHKHDFLDNKIEDQEINSFKSSLRYSSQLYI